MKTETAPKLPKGWKICSIEAWDGKCKRRIDFELSGGTSPIKAIRAIVKMIKDFK